MNILLYVFRSFPYLVEMQKTFPDLVTVNTLKPDLEVIKKRIVEESPEIVLGVAGSRYRTRVETLTINKFGKGSVNKNGKSEYQLIIPESLNDLQHATRPSDTFCNWMMYKLAEFVEHENLVTQTAFVHIKPNEFTKILLPKFELLKTPPQLKII